MRVMQQVVFQIAAAWVLSRFGKLELVWLAPLIGELLTVFVAVFLNRIVKRSVQAEANRLPDAPNA